jgi:hypothetical protein
VIALKAAGADGPRPGGAGGTSSIVRFTLDRNLGSAASQQVGPASVNLLTGNYTVSDTDVNVDSYGADLALTRTFNTRRTSSTGCRRSR